MPESTMTEDPAPDGSFAPLELPVCTEGSLKRVFEAAECRTQVELASFLGIRQSSISDAKRRGSVPAEWLLKLLLLKGINPAWVMTGQGARWLKPTEQSFILPLPMAVATECSPEDYSTEVLLKELLRRAVQGRA